MAEYSSGPVTPSMRKRPAPSKWPRLSHSRAVSISSSSPISLLEVGVGVGHPQAVDGAGDVGVDVECGRARGPVARALLAVDRAPRERRAAQPELLGPRTRQIEGAVPPAQGLFRELVTGVAEHAAARRTRCPRRRGRRSRARSGPWPGWRAPRPAPRPGEGGTARSAAPAGSRDRRRARRRRRPSRRRGTRAGSGRARRSPRRPRSRGSRRPGRAATRPTAARTSGRRGA